jgi:hypothetical protein
LESLLKYLDSDGSGTIDYAEFANLINFFSNASPKEQTRLFKPAVLLAVRKLCRGCVPDAEEHCRTFMHLPAAIRSSLLHSVSERPNRSLQSVVFRNLFGTHRTSTSGGVQMSLTIKKANCMPVIEAEEDSFYDFEVIERSVLTTVCAHDGESSSPVYLGNVYRSDVAYDPKRPDRWVFDDSAAILVKAELPSSVLENKGKRSERNSTSAGTELFLLVEFHVCVRQTIKDQKDTRKKKRGRRDKKGKRSNKTYKNKKGGGGQEERKSHDHDSDDDSDFEGERKQNSDDSDDGASGSRKSGLKSMKERSLHMCCGWAKIPLQSAKIQTLPSEHTIFCGNPWSGDGVEVSNIVAGRKKDNSKGMGLRKFFPGATAAQSVLKAKCRTIEDDLRFLPKAMITRLDSKDSLQLYHEYVRTSRKCVGAETPGNASKSPTNGAPKSPKQGGASEAQVALSDAMFPPQGQHHAGVALDPTIKVFPQILGDSSTFNAFKELVAKKGFMAGARKAMAARSNASSSTMADAPAYHVAFQNCVLAFWPAVSATVNDKNVKQQLLRDCVKAGLSTDEPNRSSHFSVGSPTIDPGTYTPFNIDEIHGGGS